MSYKAKFNPLILQEIINDSQKLKTILNTIHILTPTVRVTDLTRFFWCQGILGRLWAESKIKEK